MGSWPEYPEIDREQVEKAFTAYAEGYDLSDVKNRLKYDHTFRVAAMCDAISDSLSLERPRKDLAWLTGMLHDIGRFEQVRRYHTFRDGDSVNHAQLSADILFHDGLIRRFVSNPSKDALIEKTIRLHNVYNLPDSLTEEEYLFATILRDADKIDIIRVNVETPMEEVYDLPTEAFRNAPISDFVLEDILGERNVDRRKSKTAVDYLIGHIAFIYGIVYPESIRQIDRQGYLSRMLEFESDLPDTNRKFNQIKEAVAGYINKRLGR